MEARRGYAIRKALLLMVPMAVFGGVAFVRGVTSPASELEAIWSKRFGTSGARTHARAVAADAAGDVVTAGAFVGAVDFGGGSVVSDAADEDVFVAKYSSDGRYSWSHTSRGSRIASAAALTTDSAGNVFVAG